MSKMREENKVKYDIEVMLKALNNLNMVKSWELTFELKNEMNDIYSFSLRVKDKYFLFCRVKQSIDTYKVLFSLLISEIIKKKSNCIPIIEYCNATEFISYINELDFNMGFGSYMRYINEFK